VKLYRAMTPAADGLPQVSRSARSLGVRTPDESNRPDVTATDPADIIQPGTGGMSTAANDPANLPPLRRPTALGGTGKDPVWELDTDDLGPDLQARQDGKTHVLIEPARAMTLDEFEQALTATRAKWVRHTG
jgi:hypothetical protein